MKKEVWLRMAMEIADCRLEKDWANFFKVFSYRLEKSLRAVHGLFSLWEGHFVSPS